MSAVDALLLFALVCGGLSALRGRRTPIALLGGVIIGSSLSIAGVQFSPLVWLTIDFTIIAIILSVRTTVAEKVILSLFIPAWVMYVIGGPLASDITSALTAAQLLLTVRWKNIWKHAHITSVRTLKNDDFDLRVVGDSDAI